MREVCTGLSEQAGVCGVYGLLWYRGGLRAQAD